MAVTIGEELFAEYRTDSAGRPVLWPVIGPTGEAMTRSYPVGKRLPGESRDHPHHRGVWFGHQDVAGIDFWHDPDPKKHRKRGRQVHQRFERTEGGDEAVLVAINHWVGGADDRLIATDRRTLRFGADKDCRWIDFAIELTGASGPLLLGDAKDGVFAVRVPGSMKVDAGRGGQIVNSRGRRGAQAWGLPAAWVDYHGPATSPSANEDENATVGVAMMSHPDNFRPEPRWHVRTYGLFTANPLGEALFPPAEPKQGAITVPSGESLRLRYRLLLHTGDEKVGRVAERFAEFCKTSF